LRHRFKLPSRHLRYVCARRIKVHPIPKMLSLPRCRQADAGFRSQAVKRGLRQTGEIHTRHV
jgi:hypothetical protein